MNKSPYVSILIPTSNRADSLSRALESLSHQQYDGQLEVIIIDDGSTDGTRALVEDLIPAWGTEKLRYTFIPKGNISYAKNKGIEMAHGDIIVSTDDDCTFGEDWLATLVSSFQNPKIGAAGGADKAPLQMAPLAGAVDYGFTGLLGSGGVRSGGKGVRVARYFPRGCNMAFRKSLIEQTGNFDPLMYNGEEIDLDYRILKAGSDLVFQDGCTVVHHRRATLKGLVRQIFGRGITRRMLFLKHPEYFELGYFIPAFALAGLLGMIFLSPFIFPIKVLLFASLIGYPALLITGGFHCFLTRKKIKEALCVPIVLFIQHFVYGAGILFASFTKPYKSLKKKLRSQESKHINNSHLKIIHSNDGYGPNQGDRAILEVMTEDLNKAFPGIEIRGFLNSWVPGPKAFLKFWSNLKWADIFLLGGGQVLHDQTCLLFLLASLGKLVLARLAGTPSVCYAMGVGPISSRIGRTLTRIVLAKCALIIVRDEASKALLEEIGIQGTRIEVTADPAFRLNPSENLNIKKYFPDNSSDTKTRPVIALCPRRWFHYSSSILPAKWKLHFGKPQGTDKFNKLLDLYTHVIDRFVSELNAQVLLIPMKRSEKKNDPGQDDDVVCTEIKSRLSDNESVNVLKDNLAPTELKSLLGNVDCLVSMRMHAVIFAASQGIPCVGIGLSKKFGDLFNRMDIKDQLLDVRNVDEGHLFCLVQKALSAAKEDINAIRIKANCLSDISLRNIDLLENWWLQS